jgi:hypothetical protein
VSRLRWRYRAAALGLAAAATTTLTGCLPDVSMSPGISTPEPARTSAASSPSPTVVPVEAPPRPIGDLDTGTATHVLPAGDRTVVVDYWTDEAATAWTAAGTKTVKVSAHLENDTSGQAVLVTRFLATADDGAARTTVVEDRGEFAVQPPFSYGTVLSLQPSAADADKITLYVQLELLVETAPKSGRYFRQTVLDSLALPLIKENRK